MISKSALFLALACAAAVPLSAGHHHGRDCGHYYSRSHGGWVAFSVVTPWGAGAFGRGYDRGPRYRSHRGHDRGYYDRGYYGEGRYYRDKHAYKRYLKQRRKHEKRRHRGHHRRGGRY